MATVRKPRARGGAKVHLDTTGAHEALDDLARRMVGAKRAAAHRAKVDDVRVAQALKRYNRRNGLL